MGILAALFQEEQRHRFKRFFPSEQKRRAAAAAGERTPAFLPGMHVRLAENEMEMFRKAGAR